MSPKHLLRLTSKDPTEIIVYQIGEVKNLLENMNIKVDNYQEKMDIRVRQLEAFKVTQEALNNATPKVDIQKIILATFSLVSTIVAIALGIKQSQ